MILDNFLLSIFFIVYFVGKNNYFRDVFLVALFFSWLIWEKFVIVFLVNKDIKKTFAFFLHFFQILGTKYATKMREVTNNNHLNFLLSYALGVWTPLDQKVMGVDEPSKKMF